MVPWRTRSPCREVAVPDPGDAARASRQDRGGLSDAARGDVAGQVIRTGACAPASGGGRGHAACRLPAVPEAQITRFGGESPRTLGTASPACRPQDSPPPRQPRCLPLPRLPGARQRGLPRRETWSSPSPRTRQISRCGRHGTAAPLPRPVGDAASARLRCSTIRAVNVGIRARGRSWPIPAKISMREPRIR